jgi:signal transduction histidine kinase
MNDWAHERLVDVSPEEVELPRRLRQYVNLRWLAIAAILTIVVLTQWLLGIGYPLAPVLGTVGVLFVYNVIFYGWAQREPQADHSTQERMRRAQAFANAQIVADLLTLTILIHFTGGAENPFFLYYFVHISFAGILLPARDAYLATALAIALFSALAVAEYARWIPHIHLEGFLPVELAYRATFVVAVLVAFASTLSLVAFLATRIVAELRRRREEHSRARERQLERAQQELDELDRMRSFFLALASHDLKTPLAVVVNYIQTILDGYVGEVEPKQRRWLERSVVRLEEMVQLINDFLDASQLDEERIKAEMEPTGLDGVAQEALEVVAARANERNVILKSDIPQDLPRIQGSPKRLCRLLVNLLDNGIKFTPNGGEVTLALFDDPGCVRIEVTDMGGGIPAHYLPHIFEDFFRVRRKEFVPGAGIGLSTARRIVEAHGGEIWVQSPYRPDRTGSKFICSLPKASLDVTVSPAAEPRPNSVKGEQSSTQLRVTSEPTERVTEQNDYNG